ncbi:DUF6456 domain-containing protein [Shimia sp.]|uniref:DUF6456 domain-containing protein n=1 Tax=Shimia sp. TaxID=1954381 RepID=UPI003B8B747C
MPTNTAPQSLPKWLPISVERYVAHTEQGVSIRELARRDGCHASTVLRQIRKLEMMRDDPLVDAALNRFRAKTRKSSAAPLLAADDSNTEMPKEEVLRAEGLRILNRLCETGAVLAVASDMENAVVVRDGGTRTGVVSRQIAQAMALKDWISCAQPGRISRYVITPAGRAALSKMTAASENCALGFAEAQARFGNPNEVIGQRARRRRAGPGQVRFNMAESPLTGLSRRRDKDGERFLSEAMVGAGERLREDFELAQMGPGDSPGWEAFLRGPCDGQYQPDPNVGRGPASARQRVVDALLDLGPGLCDVALRCCCYLEGLETAERRLGWSARSGKIVLRIALIRLRDHYQENAGGAGDYIG